MEHLPPCIEGKPHKWDIERANGPISKGVCRNCKQEALFTNNIPQISRGDSIYTLDREMVAARTEFYRKKLLPDPLKRFDVL